MKQMSYMTRWTYSTSHKDMAMTYLMYGMMSAMMGTGMSVMMRAELSNGNSQFFHGNNHAFNVIITGHAMAMIFLFVMPVTMGAFGNFFLPMMIGAVDMAFARLNNISFWCLPPGLVCIMCSVTMENGAGTGWTVDMTFWKMSFDAWTTFMYFFIYMYKFMEYSFYLFYNSVKISMNMGKYACMLFNNNMHQRTNMMKYKYLTYKHYNKNNIMNFDEWLVGFTDGDGYFNIYMNETNLKINFTFKLSQNKYNSQLLYLIKNKLKVGKVVSYDNTVSYILRDVNHMQKVMLPIFDKYYLLTSKYYNYLKFKECMLISNNDKLSQEDKMLNMKYMKNMNLPNNYRSPKWNNINYKEMKSVNQIYNMMTKSWLTGFIEAEGNFFYTKKSDIRYMHTFSMTQKLDPMMLYSMKHMLHMKNKMRYYNNFYKLETSNSRSMNFMMNYFMTNNHKNMFKGMKSLEFTLWKRTFNKDRKNYEKMYKMQQMVRKLKKN
uniref:Endonuclease, COX1 group I intron encoded n=1 Tax=Pichia sorbitophila (strain ATCC MYA-4447 / BCRC 22081 / CBS 7064 / NBRC 10061 / NRRL Y-12695) TaxID=559304 RepID=C7U030_PICSO|nr:endonuclease [Millerozyma farinosa]CAY39286.1 Endonuclease, COX1 group I intron encoded [Millerozyma farinosa]